MAPLDRVYQEIAILKKLDHVNIVKLIEVSCFSAPSCTETFGWYCRKRIFLRLLLLQPKWVSNSCSEF